MKIPFKFQEIDNLDHTIYKNKFNAAVKKLKAKVTSAETAVEIFIHQEFSFAGGDVQPLILIGKLNGPWKKWVKDSVKANKKMTMIGRGYVETADNGSEVFKFIRLKGNVKVNKVAKAARQVLNKVKLSISEVEGLEVKAGASEDEELINAFFEEVAEAEDNQEETINPKEQAKVLIQEISAIQMDITNNIKSANNKDSEKGPEKGFSIIGMILILQDKMEEKIEELRKLGIAGKYVFKFEQNLQMIREKTNRFEKIKARIEGIESTMKSMITEINSKIDRFGAHPEYKIQL